MGTHDFTCFTVSFMGGRLDKISPTVCNEHCEYQCATRETVPLRNELRGELCILDKIMW